MKLPGRFLCQRADCGSATRREIGFGDRAGGEARYRYGMQRGGERRFVKIRRAHIFKIRGRFRIKKSEAGTFCSNHLL